MAKPKSRIGRAAIASMLGVDTNTASPAPLATAVTPVDQPIDVDISPGGYAPTNHPVRDRFESGVARADNALVLDPRRIVQRGRYVRPFTDDHRFQELMSAIEEAGRTIHVPILVRVEGPPGDVEYVLVDGTHRLEAAARLGISVPAINLGRITPERAFAIQAMANEVRATMHVVDQAAYVLVLEAQGLSRDSLQRTTGFSSGRVSELASLGTLLAALSEKELGRARQAATVTHRALRALKTAATDEDAFRRGVIALIVASETAQQESGEADADMAVLGTVSFRPDGSIVPPAPVAELGSKRYQIGHATPPSRIRRGRKALDAGGVSFDSARNARGTSVTFRMAWRARAIRQDPEVFLDRVRDALELIADEATRQYEAAVAQPALPRGKRRGLRTDSTERLWRGPVVAERPVPAKPSEPPVVSADAGDLVMPEWENPMPLPPSQRRSDDTDAAIDPRLLAGLSLPMLADRLRRRSTEFQKLDKQLSDVEQQADHARKRVRGIMDADDTERRGGR